MSETVKLFTPPGIVGSSSLFKARLPPNAESGQKPKFYLRILFDADALKTPQWKAMEKALLAAGTDYFGDKFLAMWKEDSLRKPVRKDIATKGLPEWCVAYLNLNANEENPPGVVDRQAQPIIDPREIYPGVQVHASIGCYAYGGKKTGYSPGINFGLRNVQKLAGGPKLPGAHADAKDDFGALDPQVDADEGGSDLNSLLG